MGEAGGYTRDATTIGVIQKVCSLKREGELSLKANKNEQGEVGGGGRGGS